MAGTAKVGDFVKFSPDRGNENPNGKTILHGKVTAANEDGTFDLLLNNGKSKHFITEGNELGSFKVATQPKNKKETPSDLNDPYRPETLED